MKITSINNISNKPINLNKKNNYSIYKNNNIFFNANYYTKTDKKFNADLFLDELKHENAEKKYCTYREINNKIISSEEILPNKEIFLKLKELDSLTTEEKKEFILAFSKLTGFPDLNIVKKMIEAEIINSIHKLGDIEDFDVKFIGYDANCSTGRKIALPGSDCDALYMIIDKKNHAEPWFAAKVRWDYKDVVNQRILSTPANHLPEILDLEFIQEGLELAQNAFKQCDFSDFELRNFQKNLEDNTNNFVQSAEFNIKLARKIPKNKREIYYKTAMLTEIIRDGIVNENAFDSELNLKIINSPLYKYSNLMKQKGLSKALKSKHIERQKLKYEFQKMTIEEKFQLIKDILYFSFGQQPENKNKKYFSNVNENNQDEMGNIVDMYNKILNIPYDFI